jgi:hypothetical protein
VRVVLGSVPENECPRLAEVLRPSVLPGSSGLSSPRCRNAGRATEGNGVRNAGVPEREEGGSVTTAEELTVWKARHQERTFARGLTDERLAEMVDQVAGYCAVEDRAKLAEAARRLRERTP